MTKSCKTTQNVGDNPFTWHPIANSGPDSFQVVISLCGSNNRDPGIVAFKNFETLLPSS
jgi:hypothetical protein